MYINIYIYIYQQRGVTKRIAVAYNSAAGRKLYANLYALHLIRVVLEWILEKQKMKCAILYNYLKRYSKKPDCLMKICSF